MIGRTLGRYEIVRQLGAGGMGVVYAARDTELEREVAIKILPPELSDRYEARAARFEREAKAIAALAHPNICTLYDVGHDDGVHFLVMELIDGESLADRLTRGALSLDEVLRYGAEIADALDGAHRKGVVHRDIKPGNVMLTKTGAKLLDFGIAQVRQASPEELRDLSTAPEPLTGDGEILGTFRYMAPEQLEGKQADARTDIFALGVVLYEMATGTSAFEATSRASLIAAILSGEPRSVRELQPLTPPVLEHVIRKCLEKDPDNRWQSARDVAAELQWTPEEASDAGVVTHSANAVDPRWKTAAATLGVAFIAALAGALWLARGDADLARGTQVRGEGAATSQGPQSPKLVRLTWEPGPEWDPSISPDGSSFVYQALAEPENYDIFFRRIGGETAVNLTKNCPSYDSQPMFSPDGQAIVYRSECDGGGIFIMGATGESRRRLTDFGATPRWSPDGRSVVFDVRLTPGKDSGLWTADVASSSVRRILEGNARQPSWSPSGNRIAFHRVDEKTGTPSLATVAVEGGSLTDVMTLNETLPTQPFWTREGIFFRTGEASQANISRIRVSELTGEKLGDVEQVTLSMTWALDPAATMDGRRIVFASVNASMEWGVSSFDPDGNPELSNWRSIRVDPRDVKGLYPSPDGEWVATVNFESFPGDAARAASGDWTDVMLIRTSAGETLRLTNDADEDRVYGWTPDGSRVVLNRQIDGRFEVWWIRRDGSGLERVATGRDNEDLRGGVISSDGRWLFAAQGENWGACMIDLGVPVEERKPVALPPLPDGKTFVVDDVSPDGRWLVGSEFGRGSSLDFYLYDLDKKQYTKLTEGACLDPSGKCSQWLPDSRRILFLPNRSETQLGLIDRKTREITIFPNTEGATDRRLRVALSRDGKLLFTYEWRRESDIWMLDYGNGE